MKTVIRIIYALLILISGPSMAGETEFEANAPSTVEMGEHFRVSFSLNARPESFEAPVFNNFRVLSGPSQSTSTSTQIINNQVITTVSYSYTYILEARSEGNFTIPPATATVDGTKYSTDEIHLEVIPPGRDDSRQTEETTVPGPEDIFIRVSASNIAPYRGEQVIVSYKLYTRLPVTNYSVESLPGFSGLWAENLSESRQTQPSVEEIDGVNYNTVEISRMALFPQRSGQIRIEPMEVEMTVRMRQSARQGPGSLFDEFFGGTSLFDRYQTIPHKVSSESLSLNVKPLPYENRPDNFSGAVGTFSMASSISREEVKVNEAVNLVVRVEGKGNLRMVDAPRVRTPGHVEIFDPQIRDNITPGRDGINGSREFDHLIIPRRSGRIEIPEIEFSYFDPVREVYVESTSGPFIINADGDTGSETPLSQARNNIQEDIRFIRTRNVGLTPAGRLFFGSNAFFILLLTPPLLLIIFALLLIRHKNIVQDKTGMRIRRAQRVARRRLVIAKRLLEENRREEFFDEVFRTLWGYVSDRLNIPVSKLSKNNVYEAFRSVNIDGELAQNFLEGLGECEYARFAPGGMESPMERTYKKAMETIITLERELRNK